MESTLFEALTGAMGDAMALYGGARQTRLPAGAEPGDAKLTLERTAGLPSPGKVSTGRVTYTYRRIAGDDLLDVQALVGGALLPGVIASHPPMAGVLDVSGTYSELDGLRAAIFLDTASGQDLADLGRSLGVPRNPMLASDDQYREVIKALAYARRGTTAALGALLDALLGPGKYTIDEDPFAHPGQVVVHVPPSTLVSDNPIGKTYVSTLAPEQPAADGSFSAPAPAFGHGALTMASLSRLQPTTAAIPSAAAPAGSWVWSGANESADVQLVADQAAPTTSARLMSLNGRYTSTAPQLAVAGRTELAVVCQIFRAASLSSTLGGAGASVSDANKVVAWSARAAGAAVQVALINVATRQALSAWFTLPTGYASITLRLTSRGASLWVGGGMVGRADYAALSTVISPQVAVGNITGVSHNTSGGGPPQMAIRWLGLTSTPSRDYWQAEGVDAIAVAPDRVRLPGGKLAARHVGHTLTLRNAVASKGRNNGTFVIVEVLAADLCRVQGQLGADGTLSSDGSGSYFAPPTASFRYPDDLGKAVVVTSGGAGRVGTYPVTALFEAGTGKDLATYATASLMAAAQKAKITGMVTPSAGLSWRLDPVMVAETGIGYLLSDAGQVALGSGGQTLTPYAPLPSSSASYTLVRRRVLGGVVRSVIEATNRVFDAGPPIKMLVNPLYAHAPLEALDAYLPIASSAGVDVVVRS